MSTVVETSVKYVVLTPTPRTATEKRWSFNSRQKYNFRDKEFTTLKAAQRSLQKEIDTIVNSIESPTSNLSNESKEEFRVELEIVRGFKVAKVTNTITKEIELI